MKNIFVKLILATISIVTSIFVNASILDKVLDYFKIMSNFSHYCNLVVVTMIMYYFLYKIIARIYYDEKLNVDNIIKVLMYSYILFMIGLLFGRSIPYEMDDSFNFKSFLPLWIHHMDMLLVLSYIIGNIVAFIPLGFFISYIYGIKKGLVYSFLTILTIELSQGITKLGWFDIDDIILNSIGALLGWLVVFLLLKLEILKAKCI